MPIPEKAKPIVEWIRGNVSRPESVPNELDLVEAIMMAEEKTNTLCPEDGEREFGDWFFSNPQAAINAIWGKEKEG